MFTWGLNSSGELGLYDNLGYPTDITSWSSLAMSVNHTAGIRSDGMLFAWGLNTSGQLGDGTRTSRSFPTQIGTRSWKSVSVNNASTAAIDINDNLYAWGLNTSGQLGDGTTAYRSSPVQIGSFFDTWNYVSVGLSHTIAIKSDGKLYTWGGNTNGQLGDGTTTSRSSPVMVGTSDWSAVAASQSGTHVLGLSVTNKLYSWGLNTSGQLGDGTIVSRSSPVQIGTSSWVAITAGSAHSAAIRLGNGLFLWGAGANGEMGNSLRNPRSSPVQLGTSSWIAVSAGVAFNVAIDSNNRLFSWGFSGNGRLGQNDVINRSSPVQVGAKSWANVFAGGAGVAALAIGGSLPTIPHAWGFGTSGQIGDNAIITRSSPVLIGYSADKSEPAQVGTSSWTTVSAGGAYTAAIRSDGALFTWGAGLYGRTGQSTQNNTFSPVQVGTSSWSAVSAGFLHALAIDSNNRLFSWGYNASGQLGDNTLTYRSSPVLISSSSWNRVLCCPFLHIWRFFVIWRN